jgi:hypothetical protein
MTETGQGNFVYLACPCAHVRAWRWAARAVVSWTLQSQDATFAVLMPATCTWTAGYSADRGLHLRGT